MKDFNFDELDKAVSSLLQPDSSGQPVEQPAPISPVRPAPSHSDDDSIKAAASQSQNPPAPVAGSTTPFIKPRNSIDRQPSRSTGRAMDIMAPPSRQAKRTTTLAAPPTSTQATVQAPSQSVPRRIPSEDPSLRWPPRPADTAFGHTQDDIPSTSNAASIDQTTVQSPIKTVVDKPKTAEFEQFDGLSRHGFDDLEDDKKDMVETPAQESQADKSVETATPSLVEQPEIPPVEDDNKVEKEADQGSASTLPQSPFLADAKVEKRPLGGFGPRPTSQEQPTALGVENPISQPLQAETPEKNQITEEPKNDEASLWTQPAHSFHWLDDDDSEHDRAEPAIEDKPKDNRPAPAEEAANSPKQDKKTPEPIRLDHLLSDGHEHQPSSPPETQPDTNPATSQSAALLNSIPQQYKIAPQHTEPASHPIFDTNEYHAATLPQTQKKRHTGVIVAIILLILIAAVAAVYYFYGEQLLSLIA